MKVVNSDCSKCPHQGGDRYILRTTNGNTSKPYTLTEDELQQLIAWVDRQMKVPGGFMEAEVNCTFATNESDEQGNIYVDVEVLGNGGKNGSNGNSSGSESPVGFHGGENHG